ncbi:MAG: NAD(P)/FAD-dependent oxidoreductase [Deltaproteobacteria bacterium]|nr:NAD(P)/FAD-dependent oxidoreductase [Deltaproteobacteria bacterium]
MDRCDALIVGGGPAGSTCARALSSAGLDVIVVDRRTFPRPKVCAGWVTPPVFRDLGVTPQEYGAGRVCQAIRGFRLGLLGRPPVEVDYGRAVSHGVLRSEFDHYLLERSGARLVLGEPVGGVERAAGGWIINARFRAPVVVGAGGPRCPVARALGLGGRGPLVAALEAEFRLGPEGRALCRVDPERPELYFLPNLEGYGWCFRKGDTLNVGLGREDARGAAAAFAAFVDRLRAAGRIPAVPRERVRGHAYRLWEGAARTLVSDGALVVGDAAGLAHPKSGEGIRPAVESGLLAARTILVARGDYRRSNLEPFCAYLAQQLGPGAPQRSAFAAPVIRVAARVLLGVPALARSVVLDRWFLRRGEAPLSHAAPG